MKTEITSGTSTVADAHPEDDPDVMAKMNKISATDINDVNTAMQNLQTGSHTGKDRNANQVKAFPFSSLMLVSIVSLQLWWDEDRADPGNGDRNESHEPEDPRPVGEFDKDSTNNKSEDYMVTQ